MLPPPQDFLHISSVIGNDFSIVQAAGGNSSIKIDDVIWVKASGLMLADALNDSIFLPLELSQVLAQCNDFNDCPLRLNPLVTTSRRPSIETTLHALMPQKVVLHTHPVDVIALSVTSGAELVLSELLVDFAWDWIPYSRPGKPLSYSILNSLKSKASDVFVLANHGLLVGADSPQEAFDLQSNVLAKLRQKSRDYPHAKFDFLNSLIEPFSGYFLPTCGVVHSLATESWSFALAQMNPIYPDHVVFCGMRPWITTDLSSPPDVNFGYALVPNMGVILTPHSNSALETLLKAQAEIFLKIPLGASIHSLSDQQCLELLSWESEAYRKNLQVLS